MKPAVAVLWMALCWMMTGAADAADQVGAFDFSNAPMFSARHESGDFSEYGWRHPDSTCGRLAVVPDPTGSGRGFVAESLIFCTEPRGRSHRLYPTVELGSCYRGNYYSAFSVWISVPHPAQRGWISLATYSNDKGWQDLFGINLDAVGGKTMLGLFHVPTFGQGKFERLAWLALPMERWVSIEVEVDEAGHIQVFQDGTLVIRAEKWYAQARPVICEAHWGLYAEGNTASARLLNDDIVLMSGGRLKRRPFR